MATSESFRSGTPAVTWSPSRTKISLMTPPSRCCTTFALPSTTTVAGATTAPDSVAVDAQPPKPASDTSKSARPARLWHRNACCARSAGSATWACEEGSMLQAPCCAGIVMRRVCSSWRVPAVSLITPVPENPNAAWRMSSGSYRLTTGFRVRRHLPRPRHAFQNLMSGAESRLAAILQHENLVDFRQDAGAVGQHDDDGTSRLGRVNGLVEGGLAILIECRIRLVEDDQKGVAVESSGQ